MNDKKRYKSSPKFHARPARSKPFANRRAGNGEADGPVLLYGLHTVAAALENTNRKKLKLRVGKNAGLRLSELLDTVTLEQLAAEGLAIEEVLPRQLDNMVGRDAVHQGVILEALPIAPLEIEDLGAARLLLVLDQVTDPHNVGAIMRSCVAMSADALITTSRHSPSQTGVLAKSASGALDMINHIEVKNLSATLENLNQLGFQTIGLDSEGPDVLENSISASRVALVMGAEGKGLREKTRATCTTLARIDMPGRIKSLNVSNAAALGLYTLHKALSV